MPTKICPVCGNEFTDPKHPNKIFCSNACRYPDRITKQCEECGAEFTFAKARGTVQRFCSHRCHNAKNNRQIQVHCEVCDTVFTVPLSRAGSARYCSLECSGIGRRKPNHYITRQCEQCGVLFKKHVAQVTATTRFCSKLCASDWMSAHQTGVNHPRWKGGLVKHRGRNWKHQRREAMERDGFKCVICNRKGKRARLGVHHIRPYREFMQDYHSANILTNLVTLCCYCHPRVENGAIACPQPLL